MGKARLLALQAVSLWLLLGLTATAQSLLTTGDLTGVVMDQNGGVLPGAQIAVSEVATGQTRYATTDAEGRFTILALLPGMYRVEAAATDFQRRTEPEIVVEVGSTVDVRLTLPIAGLVANVFVGGATPFVDARRTGSSTVVTSSQIETLPTNGRDFIAFSVLTPGVNGDRTPQQGSSATSGLTFGGQRARSNSILLDGFDNNDTPVGGVRATLSQEVVREFQVLANAFSAEFGKASGGIVNIVTKSGTNRFAGGGFVFVRDESLNAGDYFERHEPGGQPIDRGKAPYSQRQFGATAGGPIRAGRTFFFAAFERLDITASNFVTIDDREPVIVFGQSVGTAVDILRRAGFPVETGNVPYSVESHQLFARVDHQLAPSQRLDVRFNWAEALDENSEPWGGLVARSRGGSLESRDLLLAAAHTWFGSARVVNDLRAQAAYRGQNVLALDPTCSGVCDLETEGGPTLEVIGVASAGRHRFSPQPRETLRYQIVDTLTVQADDHLLKVGLDYNYIDHIAGAIPLHFGGRYIFQPLPAIPGLLPQPITSIQALAAGLPAAYVQGFGNAASRYAVQDVSAFAQDDWAVGPDVTVKLGVRYQSQLWPSIEYDVPGLGQYTFSSHHNVAPRLGVAWNPAGSRRLTVHGAYGVFFDNHLTSPAGVADIVDGSPGGVRTLVLRFPSAIAAWNAPQRRIDEAAAGSFPSLVIAVDPDIEVGYAHHASAGVRRTIRGDVSLAVDLAYVRGRRQMGTLDYNPLLPDLGPDRRPQDVVSNGLAIPNSSASILQYTAYGETWYRGLSLSISKRWAGRVQGLAAYTWSKAEDTSTDYQNAFLPQDTGRGRNPNDPTGLPIGFAPLAEKGPSVQDQRHRLATSGSALLPGNLMVSAIAIVGSGRPYNVLAGADLNRDGNGGAFPPDRARRIPDDPTSSVRRNDGVLPTSATVDLRVSRRFGDLRGVELIGEVFNLFNRTNFTDVNNIFGTGPYPDSPAPTYGQFVQAAPARQAQLGIRLRF